jgi:NAD(P)-dependent dehydrogenase (short-subunit alcohol dehydrogenase family)
MEEQVGEDIKNSVLITGASKGLGLGFVKHFATAGWKVIATARNPKGSSDLLTFAKKSGRVAVEQLDVANDKQLYSLREKYADEPIDMLINNAAYRGGEPQDSWFGSYNHDTFRGYMDVNVFAPLKISEVFSVNVQAGSMKMIVSLTTALASMNNPPPFNAFEFQMISKVALNQAMLVLGRELKESGVRVVLISPGLVETEGAMRGGAAVAAKLGLDQPPPPPVPMISVDEAVSAMVKTLSELDESYDGHHIDLYGNTIPW